MFTLQVILFQHASEMFCVSVCQLYVTAFGMQVFQYLHRRHPFSLFFLFRQAKVRMEQLLDRADLLEFPVGFFQDCFIRIVKPVTFAATYRLHGLCIELPVVDCYVCVDGGRHFHADKRRLPLLSVSRSLWLLVPMNEA